MTTYGYVRKGFPYSETKQMSQIMDYQCDELFFEGQQLREVDELNEVLVKLKKNDTLVVANLQVFGRNLTRFRPIIADFRDKHIRLISVGDKLDSHSDVYFYPFLETLSKMDSDCKSELIKQQIMLSREIGKNVGRPTLNGDTIKRIYLLYHEHKWSMRRISDECNVSLGSVFKYTQKINESVNETVL